MHVWEEIYNHLGNKTDMIMARKML